jgi:hypothetical protein
MQNLNPRDTIIGLLERSRPEQHIRVGGWIRTHHIEKKNTLARALKEERHGNSSKVQKRVSNS